MNPIYRLYRYLVSRCWVLGIADFNDNVVTSDYVLNIRWIKDTHTGSWFADPFILSEDNRQFVILVEEFPYKTQRGRISRIIVDKQRWEVTDVKVVLELCTHLSFPCYFRKEGKVYVYPENSASGCLNLYEYDEIKEEMTFVDILSPLPLTDAVIYDVDGENFILSTQHPRENKNQLSVYQMRGRCPEKNATQSFTFSDNIARNAGKPFYVKGMLIRPAQICNKNYGEGMVLQEIKRMDSKFFFRELKRIYSPSKRYSLAFHTFNVFENKYIIVDAQGYRHKILGPIVEKFASIIKKIVVK